MGEEYNPDQIALNQLQQEIDRIGKEVGLAIEEFCRSVENDSENLENSLKYFSEQLAKGLVKQVKEVILLTPIPTGHVFLIDDKNSSFAELERAYNKIRSDGSKIGVIGHGINKAYFIAGGAFGYADKMTRKAEEIENCENFLSKFFDISTQEVWEQVQSQTYSIFQISEYVKRRGHWPEGRQISYDWLIDEYEPKLSSEEFEVSCLTLVKTPYNVDDFDYKVNFEPKPKPNYARTRNIRDWRFTQSLRSLGKKKGIKSAHRR